jgi:predicted nucleotidyltransferase component of viral defense system
MKRKTEQYFRRGLRSPNHGILTRCYKEKKFKRYFLRKGFTALAKIILSNCSPELSVTVDIGHDSGTPVDPVYKSKGEFPFTGTIQKISFKVKS